MSGRQPCIFCFADFLVDNTATAFANHLDRRDRLAGSDGFAARAQVSDEGNASLRALFVSLDADADGRVSRHEWGSALGRNRALMGRYFGG